MTQDEMVKYTIKCQIAGNLMVEMLKNRNDVDTVIDEVAEMVDKLMTKINA